MPDNVAMIEGPIFAFVYLCAFGFCLHKLWTARFMQSEPKVMLALSCLILILEGFFWLVYYLDYPPWLFGVLLFMPKSLEISLIERLAASWTSIYKKHLSFVNTEPYNHLAIRISGTVSVVLQLMFLSIYLAIYVGKSETFFVVIRILIITTEAIAVPYLIISAYRLNSIIKDYLEPSYTQKITFIAFMTSVCCVIRFIIGLIFILKREGDLKAIEDDWFYWVIVATVQIYAVASIAFILTVTSILVTKRKSKTFIVRELES